MLRSAVVVLLACKTCSPSCGSPDTFEPPTPEHSAELATVCFTTLTDRGDAPTGPFVLIQLNRDDLTDVVQASDDTVSVRHGLPIGGFGSVLEVAQFDGNVYDLRTGDVNGDGLVDVVAATFDAATHLLGDGDGLVRGPETQLSEESTEAGSSVFDLADVDADGDAEMIVGDADEVFAIFLDPEGTVTESRTILAGMEVLKIVRIELDGDPETEVLVSAGPSLWAMEPAAESPVRATTGRRGYFEVADVDSNGIDEIVVLDTDSFPIYSWTDAALLEVGRIEVGHDGPRAHGPIAVGDVDCDGTLDVVSSTGFTSDADSCGLVSASLGTIDVWLANGRSSWLEHELESSERPPGLLDLDGDGRSDLVYGQGRVAMAEDCGA